MSENIKKRCFVITPIGDDTDPIRRHIDGIIEAAIVPALGSKYVISVSHKISEPGSITKQIISEIYQGDLVIANLTDKNPNVMYELAFRHTLGLPVIMIAEKGTSLPADIIMQRTIFYCNDAKGVLELKEELKKAEEEISFDKKCGPIYEVLGELSHDTTVLQQAQGTLNTDVGPLEYILKRLNRIEDAIIVSNQHIRQQYINEREKFPRMTAMLFTYEELTNKLNLKFLHNQLSKVHDIVDPDATVDSVSVDKDKKVIEIYIKMTGLLDVPAIYQYFTKVLSEYGFEGAMPRRQRELKSI